MKEIFQKYLKWFFPILFIGYFCSVSLFEHAHIVDGVIVVHSHAAENSPFGLPHQHQSDAEIQKFHFLSHYNALDGSVRVLTVFFTPYFLRNITVPLAITAYFGPGEEVCFLRGPPVV